MSLVGVFRESLPRLPSDSGLFPLGRAFTEKLCEDGEWALSEHQRKLVCAPAVSVEGVSVAPILHPSLNTKATLSFLVGRVMLLPLVRGVRMFHVKHS